MGQRIRLRLHTAATPRIMDILTSHFTQGMSRAIISAIKKAELGLYEGMGYRL